MEKIKWGIIGCGNVCEVKSAPAMNLIAGSELVGVMRRNEEKVRDYATRHQVPKWYTDAEELINDPDINAIYIATPPSSHAEYTKMAAKAGKPVYVEKPMAIDYEQCQSMIAACAKADVPLFVAYYRRCLPNFLKVKELIDEGAIGEVRMVQLELYKSADPKVLVSGGDSWRVNPEIAGGGYFFDLASHQFDFLDYVIGPIKRATGIKANQAGLYEAEDIVTASFEFENGALGTGSWCFTASELARKEEAVIIGSEGIIKFHFFTGSKVEVRSTTLHKTFDFDFPKHIQQPLIQTIIDELHGNGKCPSDGISGARTNWVMGEILS